MKIRKSSLIKLILQESDYVSDDRSSFMFYGDHVWPDLNPNNPAEEENTQLEAETLDALVNYYQTNDPFSSANLPPHIAEALKEIVTTGKYPRIFKKHIGFAYRGMALYEEDYRAIFGVEPLPTQLSQSEHTKTVKQIKKEDLSPEEAIQHEKDHEKAVELLIDSGVYSSKEEAPGPYDPVSDDFLQSLTLVKIPLRNYYERFITFLSREPALTGTTARYMQHKNPQSSEYESYGNLERRNFSEEEISAYQTRTGLEDSSYSDYIVSDWTNSKRKADMFAKQAAVILKKKRKDSHVIPFVVETNGLEGGTFVSIFDALQNFPSVLNSLSGRIDESDLLLIGDAQIFKLFKLDTRGMGLHYPITTRIVFSRIANAFEDALTGTKRFIGDMYDSTLKILGIREGKSNSIKMTRKELEQLIIQEMARHYFPKGVKNPSAENRKTGMALGAVAGSFYPAPYALGVLAGAVAGYFAGDVINVSRGYEEGRIYDHHPLLIENIRKNCDITNLASIEKYIRDNGGIDESGRPRVKYNVIDFSLFGKVAPEDKKLLLALKNLGLFETKMDTVKAKLPFIGDN